MHSSCSRRRRRAASGAAPGRLRADEQEAPVHRQAAPGRRPHRRARGRVALHARRLRLLLMAKLVFITQQVDPRPPGARGDGAEDPALAELVDEVVVLADGAVEGSPPRELPRAHLPRAAQGAARRAVRDGARARAARAPRGSGRRPHVPDLRGARRAARAAAPHPAGALVHALADELAAAAAERASTAVTTVDYRSFPFPSKKLRAIGHGIDLAEFPCSPPREGEGSGCSRSGATRPRRGSTSWSRPCRSRATTSSCTSTARRSTTRSGRIERSSSSSSASSGSRGA